MKIQEMEEAAGRVCDLMGMLANRNRLMILCQLVERERSVGELAQLVGAREPAVSQQLAAMRREGIVAPRREGQTIHYRLARDDVRELIGFLYATYCRPNEGDEQ